MLNQIDNIHESIDEERSEIKQRKQTATIHAHIPKVCRHCKTNVPWTCDRLTAFPTTYCKSENADLNSFGHYHLRVDKREKFYSGKPNMECSDHETRTRSSLQTRDGLCIVDREQLRTTERFGQDSA